MVTLVSHRKCYLPTVMADSSSNSLLLGPGGGGIFRFFSTHLLPIEPALVGRRGQMYGSTSLRPNEERHTPGGVYVLPLWGLVCKKNGFHTMCLGVFFWREHREQLSCVGKLGVSCLWYITS